MLVIIIWTYKTYFLLGIIYMNCSNQVYSVMKSLLIYPDKYPFSGINSLKSSVLLLTKLLKGFLL